jgi:hypothetical protein
MMEQIVQDRSLLFSATSSSNLTAVPPKRSNALVERKISANTAMNDQTKPRLTSRTSTLLCLVIIGRRARDPRLLYQVDKPDSQP